MDPVTLTLLTRGLIALALAVGGVAALRYGFVLFRDGHGTGRSAASIKFGKLMSASANLALT